MSDFTKQIIDFLNCEHEIFTNQENDQQLIKKFNEWTIEGKTKGFIPVVIVPSDTLAETLELALEGANLEQTAENIAQLREDILQKAQTVDVQEFFKKRLDEYLQMHEDYDIMGSFEESEPAHCFYSYYNYQNQLASEIILAKIPTKNPWEIAAWLPMGGFNDCPMPHEQVAVFRYWYEKYQAVPALVTFDNWELELQKPPTNQEDALILAKEHFAFCYDRVMQAGAEKDNLNSLTSELINSTTWYFWWD